MGSLFQEIKRRKVFRVAAIYAVVAWVLIQVADVVLPTFGAPEWVNQTIIFLFILGFLPTLIAAWAYEITPAGVKPEAQPATGPTATSTQPINYLILAIVLLMAGVQLGDRLLFSTGDEVAQSTAPVTNNARGIRANINLGYMDAPDADALNFLSYFDFTSDGSNLIYRSVEDGVHKLYLRNLASLESELIFTSNGEPINFPSVSPDGNWIAYSSRFPNEDLYLVSTNSGTSRLLVEDVETNCITWLDADSILYGRSGTLRVYSLESSDSAPLNNAEIRSFVGVTPRMAGLEQIADSNYLLLTVPESRNNPEARVEVYDVVTGNRSLLLNNAYSAIYVESGHLIFMRGNNLWAAPFDPESLMLRGRQVMLVEGIEGSAVRPGDATFAVSSTGQLVYLPGGDIVGSREKQLVWIERGGSEYALDLPAQQYEDPVISPDGRQLALTIHNEGRSDIWVHDFAQPGILNRVTSTGDAMNPVWTPDGQSLVFYQALRGIGKKNANGLGLVESYLDSPDLSVSPRAFAQDGTLLFNSQGDGVGQNINRLDLTNLDRPFQALLNTDYREYGPSVSPDGRFLAYSSNETGEEEIYIRPFPDVGSAKWRVSINGGSEPKWGRSGIVLHYASSDRNSIISAEIQMEPEFSVLSRMELAINTAPSGVPFYAVGETDDRFLFMRPANQEALEAREINFGQEPVLAVLVDNFFAELKRLAPPDPQ